MRLSKIRLPTRTRHQRVNISFTHTATDSSSYWWLQVLCVSRINSNCQLVGGLGGLQLRDRPAAPMRTPVWKAGRWWSYGGADVCVWKTERVLLCTLVPVCEYVWKIKGNPGHRGGQRCDSEALLATKHRNVLRAWARGSRLPWNNHTRVNIGPAGQRLNACRSQDGGGLQPDIGEGSHRLGLCSSNQHYVLCCPATSAVSKSTAGGGAHVLPGLSFFLGVQSGFLGS